MDHADIIDALGGPGAIGKALGCHHSQPVRWKERGIPPRRWAEIVRLAGAQGRSEISFEVLAARPEKAA